MMVPRRLISTVTAAIAATALLASCGPGETPTTGGPAAVRQITESQYRSIVADVFGTNIRIAGEFDPIARTNGLIAVGASRADITPSAFERYSKLARLISEQVVAPGNRGILIPCKPRSEDAADDACAARFFEKVGRPLYRRPLTKTEIQRQVALAAGVADSSKSFYAGLGAGLTGMLVSPDFLLIADMAVPDPKRAGTLRLDAYSMASRLSFLLWNAEPDEILLTAAEKGDLDSRSGLARQVDRMLASPRLEAGVRALFSDMLGFDGIQTLEKDPAIYPAFSLAAANDAREQTLRTITAQLVTKEGDYRDLFTTRETFLTGALGMLYRVGVQSPKGWVPFTFPADDPHVGIQSQIGLLALYSQPGRSSATIRGKAIRELLLCQKVPSPPANVDFTLVSDSSNPIYKTARERLGAHSKNPSCAGCHRIMDPIGLGLETFDGAGQRRDTENGVPIDSSGTLDGINFRNPDELGHALHDNPAIASCFVNRVYAFATGHDPVKTQGEWIDDFKKQFAQGGYRLKPLLRSIATSDGFYRILSNGNAGQSARSTAGLAKESAS